MAKCKEFIHREFLEDFLCAGNIMNRKVYFYEDGSIEKNKKFCKTNNITFLPAKDGESRYQIDKSTSDFTKEKIPHSQKIQCDEKIFSEDILEKFEKNLVLFVYTDNKIVGVVHFSDYNSPIVYQYLYYKLMEFEETLRKYLVANNLSNENIIDFFIERVKSCDPTKVDFLCSRIAYFKKQEELMRELRPFQIFNLTDLIFFGNSKFGLRIDDRKIKDLRNCVMHFKMLIRYDTNSGSEFIFDYTSFEKLLENMEYLEEQQVRINELIKS